MTPPPIATSMHIKRVTHCDSVNSYSMTFVPVLAFHQTFSKMAGPKYLEERQGIQVALLQPTKKLDKPRRSYTTELVILIHTASGTSKISGRHNRSRICILRVTGKNMSSIRIDLSPYAACALHRKKKLFSNSPGLSLLSVHHCKDEVVPTAACQYEGKLFGRQSNWLATTPLLFL